MLGRATSLIPITCSTMARGSRIPGRCVLSYPNTTTIRSVVRCNRWYSQTTKHYAPRISSSSSSAGYTPPKERGFQIPPQGIFFMIFMVPVAFMATYEGRYGPTDESVQGEVGERYAARIAEHRAKQTNRHMAEFFQAAIFQQEAESSQQDGGRSSNKSKAVDDELHRLLLEGKGSKKRKLYNDGTATEGVAEKTPQEEQGKEMQQEKMQKEKAGETNVVIIDDVDDDEDSKKETAAALVEKTGGIDAKSANSSTTAVASSSATFAAVDNKSLAMFAVVAATVAAATAGFLAGGNRSK